MKVGSTSAYRAVLERFILLMVGVFLSGFGQAETPKTQAPDPDAPPSEAAAQSRLKQISEHVFALGEVRFDKQKRRITFPAVVNMDQGLVEYFAVNAVGKLHESVQKTYTQAADIHVAALLLGAKGAQTNLTVQQFDSGEIPGDKIQLLVMWKKDGTEKSVRAEELIYNSQRKGPMTRGPWVYNGSQVIDGTFIAGRDGSLVSIISDPFALVNSPRPGRENDEIWQVNTNTVPPMSTPVEVVIQLEGK